MKLIYCPICRDLVKIIEERRECKCGKSWGQHLDNINAVYGGAAFPIGIHDTSFLMAVNKRPYEGDGEVFLAFVIPQNYSTFKKGNNNGTRIQGT